MHSFILLQAPSPHSFQVGAPPENAEISLSKFQPTYLNAVGGPVTNAQEGGACMFNPSQPPPFPHRHEK